MERHEAWANFWSTTIIPSRLEQVVLLHQHYRERKDTLVEEIVRLLDEVCQEVNLRQAEGTLQECTLIRVSFLRTSLLEGEFEYIIEAVDEASSACYEMTRFKYNANWLYPYYEKWNALCHAELKKYIGVIKPWYYELWQSQQLYSFQTYVVHLIRYAVVQLEQLPSFQIIQLAEEFEVIVGEYGDVSIGESVYFCKSNPRTKKSMLSWLAEQLPHGYVHEHIAHVDLSGTTYEGINLNYARLEQVNLSSVHWPNASLIGSRFNQCDATEINVTGSLLFDADFTHSVLTGANFNETIAPLDALNEEDAVYFGMYQVAFGYADLTHASFQDATLAADFRGALLHGVNFQGADLTGSLMLREDEGNVHLTPAQRLTIRWS